MRRAAMPLFLGWWSSAALASLLVVSAPAQGVSRSAVVNWGDRAYDTRSQDLPTLLVAAGHYATALLRADNRVFLRGGGWPSWPVPPGRTVIDLKIAGGGWPVIMLDNGQFLGAWYGMALPALPAGMSYSELAPGWDHLLAVRSDGTLFAVGFNHSGQLNVPTLAPGLGYVDAGAGNNWSVAVVSDGTLRAWGSNALGQTNLPAALPVGVVYVTVDAGEDHTLALRSDGLIDAFGDNGVGQCNVVPLPPGTAYDQIAAGNHFSAAWRSDGVFVAWGNANNGQHLNVPQVPPGVTCVQLDAGNTAVVALMSDSRMLGWGNNVHFAAFVPGLPPTPVGQAPIRHVEVGTGGASILLLSDGSVQVFGSNLAGQQNIPQLPAGMRYVKVEGAAWHMAALRSDGQLLAFGDNTHGRCNVPPLPAGVTYTDVALSSVHTVALRSDGLAVAFGLPSWGVLNIPALPPGVVYTQVDAYYTQTMLLRSDGEIVCIGDNGSGQLNVPPLPPGLVYTDLAAGSFFNAALRSDGRVLAWGGTNSSSFYNPPPLPRGVYYVEADSANQHSVLRRSDGQIDMMGNLGDYVPQLEPGTSYVEVSANLSLETMARVGPTSTYIGFAGGCAGSRPAARLVPRDTPHIDSVLTVNVFDLPQNAAIMVFGWTRLPALSLASLGAPGCTAYVSLDNSVLLLGQNNQAMYRLPIPNLVGLIGLRFHNQALVLDMAANPLGAVVSDFAEGVVGSW